MIKINGTKIKTPTSQDIEHYNITNGDRTASGQMMMDLIAKKIKINVSYEVLKGTDLKQIRNLIDGTAMFFDVTYYDDDGVLTTKTCYAGAIKYKKFRHSATNGWYWKDVEFALIER